MVSLNLRTHHENLKNHIPKDSIQGIEINEECLEEGPMLQI